MEKRTRNLILAGLAALMVLVLALGTTGKVGISAYGVTINGKKVLGGTAYVTELRATGSSGLNLYDDSGTAGIFVEDGGQVGVNDATPDDALSVGGDIHATGHITATAYDAGDGNITNVGDIAVDTISADDGSSFSISNDWTNTGNTIADLGAVTTADINGGTIDGAVIGGAAAEPCGLADWR